MEFYQTPMGRRFFQADFPAMVRQLKRIADHLTTEHLRVEPIKCSVCNLMTDMPIKGMCHACYEQS